MKMDLNPIPPSKSRLSHWIELRKKNSLNLRESENGKISYNTSILPLPFMAWKLDPIQNRFLALANKGLAIVDTMDLNHADATLMPEKLYPKHALIADISWFPQDSSLCSFLSNSGTINLLDMNRMETVDSLHLQVPSSCLSFDTTGRAPFCVSVGTKNGVRICDFKSGSTIVNLKTKFQVETFSNSSRNNYELYTGLCDGNTLIWDMRNPSRHVKEVVSSARQECSVRQISNSPLLLGSILIAYSNGDIVSYDSLTFENINWHFKGIGSDFGNFMETSFGTIIVPNFKRIISIDSITGNVIGSCPIENSSNHSKGILNSFTNDIYLFNPDHIGSIYRYKTFL